MSIIGDFIEDLSKNQEDEYIYFIKGIRDAQPFAFLSALAFSLSIFAYSYSPKEVSIYAALAGISFLLAFISLLSFRFIKPNFGLFLFLSYIYTIIGVGFFFIYCNKTLHTGKFWRNGIMGRFANGFPNNFINKLFWL